MAFALSKISLTRFSSFNRAIYYSSPKQSSLKPRFNNTFKRCLECSPSSSFSTKKVSIQNGNFKAADSIKKKPHPSKILNKYAASYFDDIYGKIPRDIHDIFLSFCYCIILPIYLDQKKLLIKELKKNELKRDVKLVEKEMNSENIVYNRLKRIYASHFFHLFELYKFPKSKDFAVLLSIMLNKNLNIKEALTELSTLKPPESGKKVNQFDLWKKYDILSQTKELSSRILEEFKYFQDSIQNYRSQSIQLSKLFEAFLNNRSIPLDKPIAIYLKRLSVLDQHFNSSSFIQFLTGIQSYSLNMPSLFEYSPFNLPIYSSIISFHVNDMSLGLDNISFSKLNSYSKCSFQYFLKYLLRLKPPELLKVPRTMTGIALHNAVASIVKIKKETPHISHQELVVEATKEYTAKIKETKLTTEKKESVIVRDTKKIEKYVQRESLSKTVPLRVERSFAVKLAQDLPIFIGSFDRIERDSEGNIIIKEYKNYISNDSESLQLFLYSLAYERLHKIRPAKLILESLSDGKTIQYIPTEEDTKRAEEFVRSVVEMIRQGSFYASPSPKYCSACAFNQVCPSVFKKQEDRIFLRGLKPWDKVDLNKKNSANINLHTNASIKHNSNPEEQT